ncbi:MAG: DUF4131 domain-containing protein [Pseudomonadales bacterium]|nr:DUF4131 domain-containing protein [Pseudomonadales bacterium]
MRLLLVAYCLGILSGSYLPIAALQVGKPGLLFCLLALLACASIISSSPKRLMLCFLVTFLLGISWQAVWGGQQLSERLPVLLEGVDFAVEGRVLGLPVRNELGQRFEFEIIRSSTDFVRRKIRLDYFGEQEIEGGQRWGFTVRLKQPRGLANTGGFDFEAWSLQRGLNATGYVRPDSEHLIIDSLSLRARIHARLKRALTGSNYNNLIVALTLGHKGEIESELWDLFSKTGTNHLWVISGLHIGLVTGIAYFISKLVFRFFPALFSVVSLQIASTVFALTAAIFYAYLANFSLSTQRALIMICTVMVCSSWQRKLGWDLRLTLAMALVLSANPLAGQNPGFWFSFVAVAVLLFFSGSSPSQRESYLRNLISSQWKVWLGLLGPLSF